MRRKLFTEEHEEFVRRNHKEFSAVKMGKLLGFTGATIRKFMRENQIDTKDSLEIEDKHQCKHSGMLEFARKQGFPNVTKAIDAYGSRITFRRAYLKTQQ